MNLKHILIINNLHKSKINLSHLTTHYIYMKINLICMTDQETFIQYINDHYKELKNKYFNFCREKQYQWDEDIFSNTILTCYNAIEKKGKLNDTSNQGIENYFFRSFKQNLQREKQYCRVSKRDLNYNSDNINDIYEIWYNENNTPERIKLLSDLWKDFATLYIITKVEDNWDNEHFLLFRLKYLVPSMTYKKLQEKTQAKKCRQKVVDVKNWVKENITKQEIKEAFALMFGDLL